MNELQNDWINTICREYLQGYIKNGGSSVKFCISPDSSENETIMNALMQSAQDEGYVYASADAISTKLHQIERIFFSIAKQIDWDDIAKTYVRDLFRRNQYELPDSGEISLKTVAEYNQLEEITCRNRVTSQLGKEILNDYNMSHEFRRAMLRLCIDQLDPDSPFLSSAVKEWLCGELKLISTLKEAMIFQKITKHNARFLLYSLAYWLRLNKKSGLVLTLDISRFMEVNHRIGDETGFYYTRSNALDAYEILRQFIDGTDEMEGMLLVVFGLRELLTDERRGLKRYDALKMRIWDEVKDRKKQNLLGSLVRFVD